MRILFITSSKNASGGGRQALYLAEGMGERGHKVSFFSPPTSLLRSISPNLDWRDLSERRGNWRTLLERAMPENEPVIVHAFHNKAVKSLAWAGTLWRFLGRPVACVAHRGVIYPPNNILPYVLPGIQVFACAWGCLLCAAMSVEFRNASVMNAYLCRPVMIAHLRKR